MGKTPGIKSIASISLHTACGKKGRFPQPNCSEKQTVGFSTERFPLSTGCVEKKNRRIYSFELMFAVMSRRLSMISLSFLAIRASTFCREEMTVV